MASWQFEEYDGRGTLNAATAVDNFLERTVGNLATALVREGIQNSLDARRDDLPADEPVRVRLTLASIGDVDQPWLAALQPHLHTPNVGSPDGDECTGPCDVLLFEDFGTRGLTGDYENRYTLGEQNNFVNFVFHEGVTVKSTHQRGSRGVGKIVFIMASRARTFFAYTVREDEPGKPVLIGKNRLKPHRVGDQGYKGPGYFVESPSEGKLRQDPVVDAATLSEFTSTFHVKRQPEESGLSIVIPFRDESITASTLLKAVIAEYHYAMLAGNLQVEMDDAGSEVQLDADNLPATGDELVDKQVALARWALTVADKPKLQTLPPAPGQLQHLDDELVPEPVREAIIQAIDEGERVAIRMPLYVHPKDKGKGKEPVLTAFDVFMESADDFRSKPSFIRELLPISGAGTGNAAAHVRALVVIDSGELANLLRAAEGANHTNWNSNTDNFKENYVGRRGEIGFVTNAVKKLMAIVRGNDEKPVGGIATQFFSAVPDEGRTRPSTGSSGKGPDSGEKGKPKQPRTPAGFTVARTKGGFNVRRTASHAAAPRPSTIKIRVAYDVLRGSAWNKWEPADFDFREQPSPISIEGMNVEARPVDGTGNKLILLIKGEPFTVSITGFDPNRDLIIDARADKGDP